MRLAVLVTALVAIPALSACLAYPQTSGRTDPRYPTQTGGLEKIDPYHRDKIPDSPYEVRKAEMERDDHLAGRTGPTYPPLFKDQKSDADGDT